MCLCDRAAGTKGMYLQNYENRSEPCTRLLVPDLPMTFVQFDVYDVIMILISIVLKI